MNRIKYYFIVFFVFILGLMRIYWLGGEKKKKEIELNLFKKKAEIVREKKNVEDEIQGLDSDSLDKRADSWLRK